MPKLPLKIRRLLGELGNERLSSKAVSACKRIYRDFIEERFAKMSRPGSRWKALAKSTLANRARHGNKKRTKLVDTGELQDNLKSIIQITTKPSESGSRLAIGFGGNSKKHSKWVRQGDGYAKVQSNIPIWRIASWQNSGTERIPQRKILVRPNVPTTEAMVAAIRIIILKDIDG